MKAPHTPPTDPRGAADEVREMRAVVAMLRSLPDPEPPEGMADRVIAAVAAERAGRRRRRLGGVRRLADPRFAAALAAGFSGLLLFRAVQDGDLGRLFAGDETPVAESAARDTAARPPLAALRPSAGRAGLAATPSLAFFNRDDELPGPTRGLLAASDRENPHDRRLDQQLNLMLLDPDAFFQRLERVNARDQFVARLAGRAARRGDAADVAMRLRSTDHPFAPELVDEFLRSALVHYVAAR